MKARRPPPLTLNSRPKTNSLYTHAGIVVRVVPWLDGDCSGCVFEKNGGERCANTAQDTGGICDSSDVGLGPNPLAGRILIEDTPEALADYLAAKLEQ